MIAETAIESALEVLRPSLASDGFGLRAGQPAGNNVEVILSATADACLDCLVPDDLMVQMIGDAIRQQDPSLGEVTLVKEGFEGLTEHLP
jgi:hypothetical protein